MMSFDGHIHLWNENSIPCKDFPERLKKAGVSGGLLMSLPPPSFRSEVNLPAPVRIEHLFAWHALQPGLWPFFWVDPTEKDAEKQLEKAAEAGVKGFKVICDHFFPGEERPMQIFQRIADMGLPIVFHSGCLANGRDSSNFNRPMNFECMIRVRKLRFSMAHIGWPWCDEYAALFLLLKIQEKKHPDNCKMFVDNTVGTPDIYRKPVFEKLFSVCEPKERMYFGADQLAENYDDRQVAWYLNRDAGLYRELGLTQKEIRNLHEDNLRKFVEGDLQSYGNPA